jgi:hypothetical protein
MKEHPLRDRAREMVGLPTIGTGDFTQGKVLNKPANSNLPFDPTKSNLLSQGKGTGNFVSRGVIVLSSELLPP